MNRPDHIPDPALNHAPVDEAFVQMLGHLGHEGAAQTMPATYGPPEGAAPDDHNSGGLWNAYLER